jgi:hypothetical protein
VEARSTNTPSSLRAWGDKQTKFLQDQILRLMAAHDEDIVTEPIQSLATFLSLSSNTSAAQQFMAEYLQSILIFKTYVWICLFTTWCIIQLQFNYDPTKVPSRIGLFKLLSESKSMVPSSDIEIISNTTIDAAGDGDRYTQIMKDWATRNC